MGQNYIEYSLPSNLSRWHNRWVYIGNHQPGLPERNDVTPKWTVEWTQHPDATELDQVLELVKRIKALKAEGVTGASVVYSWITRRIQPLQKRLLDLSTLELKIHLNNLQRNCWEEKH